MTEYDDIDGLANGVEKISTIEKVDSSTEIKKKKAAITANAIFEKATKVMRQYRFRMKGGTQTILVGSL